MQPIYINQQPRRGVEVVGKAKEYGNGSPNCVQERSSKRMWGKDSTSWTITLKLRCWRLPWFSATLYTNWIGLDWIEQGLTSPPTQYRLSGRQLYRLKDGPNQQHQSTEGNCILTSRTFRADENHSKTVNDRVYDTRCLSIPDSSLWSLLPCALRTRQI